MFRHVILGLLTLSSPLSAIEGTLDLGAGTRGSLLLQGTFLMRRAHVGGSGEPLRTVMYAGDLLQVGLLKSASGQPLVLKVGYGSFLMPCTASVYVFKAPSQPLGCGVEATAPLVDRRLLPSTPLLVSAGLSWQGGRREGRVELRLVVPLSRRGVPWL